MKIISLVLGPVGTNCYFLINEDTKETIIIDPADNASAIKQRLKMEDLTPVAILLTHGHFDHILAAKDIAEEYNILIHAFYEEWSLLGDAKLNAGYLIRRNFTLTPHKELKDNEILNMAGMDLLVIHTPGHTKGSICFYHKESQSLITGDTLFYESVGRTDLPTGNSVTIQKSISERLFKLDDTTKVYPGHGDVTTIGHEKMYNPFLR
ncbi:MAG: beta-lactamase domain protein [Anaerocolumna sp.]|jgi:glyoxylase-like metal-dependent hydrolase (beta-lactamase superfamily II)|nr:beta-lactamase domain protein [Anaerocolumna sp.]